MMEIGSNEDYNWRERNWLQKMGLHETFMFTALFPSLHNDLMSK